MRALLLPVFALLVALSACGGSLATPPGADSGSPQAASTSTGGSTTETTTGTSPSTVTYTNVSDVTVIGTGSETGMNTATCTISASNYDHTCAVDSDCQIVATGNFCTINAFECSESINTVALMQYNANVAQTPLGSGALGVGFGCSAATPPCCRQGQCTTQCRAAPSDTLPACADAGGTCVYGPAYACGPTLALASTDDPCAYADESCCLP